MPGKPTSPSSSEEQRVLLASGSPRRAELLRQIGIPFEVVVPDVDESVLAGEQPEAYVQRLAASKASVYVKEGRVTLAADTIVVLELGQERRILGKPRSREAGIEMLLLLSGLEHVVLTAIAVTDGRETICEVVRTIVRFAHIDRKTAESYWATGEGADKAGGYGIQGIGGILTESITGSYSAVVGLPLPETERALARFGIDTWRCRLD